MRSKAEIQRLRLALRNGIWQSIIVRRVNPEVATRVSEYCVTALGILDWLEGREDFTLITEMEALLKTCEAMDN